MNNVAHNNNNFNNPLNSASAVTFDNTTSAVVAGV